MCLYRLVYFKHLPKNKQRYLGFFVVAADATADVEMKSKLLAFGY